MHEYILYLLTGSISGVLAGLFGIGGGVVVVPCLLYIFILNGFEHVMLMAEATSLAIMIGTAIASIYSHHRRKLILWPVFIRMLLGLVAGCFLGVVIAVFLPTGWLSLIFGVFLIGVALRMAFHKEQHTKSSRSIPRNIWLHVASIIIGVSSGLLGVGGGTLLIPYFTYYNISMPNASGTSAACGLPVAIAGTIGFIFAGLKLHGLPADATGYIYWPAAIMIAITSILFVPLGSKLAKRLPLSALRVIFAIVLCLTAVDLIRGH